MLQQHKNHVFRLSVMFFPGMIGVVHLFISYFRFLLLPFPPWMLTKNYHTHDRLCDYSPPTLCVFNLCIIVSYDILNQAPLVPSCYQQLMPKILIYNTSQHASESPSNHSRPISSHCSFSSLHIIRQKECKTRGDLLENNALGKCCKTFESLFVKVVRLLLL